MKAMAAAGCGWLGRSDARRKLVSRYSRLGGNSVSACLIAGTLVRLWLLLRFPKRGGQHGSLIRNAAKCPPEPLGTRIRRLRMKPDHGLRLDDLHSYSPLANGHLPPALSGIVLQARGLSNSDNSAPQGPYRQRVR